MQSIKKSERNHKTWFSNYSRNTLKQQKASWRYWTEYLESKDESWIFENKDVEDWGTHLVNFHRWLKRKGFSDNTARVRANAIRGYFKHIGIFVNMSKVQSQEISSVESNPTLDYPFNLQVKTELLRVANPEEEYIVSAGVSFGLRIGDFQKITRGMLEPLLNAEPPIQLPKIMTQKEGCPAFPFIDRDAKDAIERLLKELDAQGRTKQNSRMITLTQKQINAMFRDLFKKADVAIGTYRVRFHILRKFLTDNLAKVCSGDKWKLFVGKAAHSPYVGAEGRESYAKVLSFTNVNGRKAKANVQELDDLKAIIAEQETEIHKQHKKIEGLAEGFEKQKTHIESLNDEMKEQKELVQGLLLIAAKLQDKLAKK